MTKVHAYLAQIKDQERDVIAVPDGAGRALCVSLDKHWTFTREWDELHIIAPLVAENAEARTTPAVSRADVAEALSRCLNPEVWNVTFPTIVNEVCALFGIEAEQAIDPIEKRARELYRVATPDTRWETVADEYRRIAAHVLGEEDRDA